MSKRLGRHIESIVCDYLQKKGLTFIKRNYLCRFGEIDLIFTDAVDELVFFEVKYRASDVYGSALESVTLSKQKKIIKAAEFFCGQYKKYRSYPCRFDVIAVDGSGKINWLKDAFIVED